MKEAIQRVVLMSQSTGMAPSQAARSIWPDLVTLTESISPEELYEVALSGIAQGAGTVLHTQRYRVEATARRGGDIINFVTRRVAEGRDYGQIAKEMNGLEWTKGDFGSRRWGPSSVKVIAETASEARTIVALETQLYTPIRQVMTSLLDFEHSDWSWLRDEAAARERTYAEQKGLAEQALEVIGHRGSRLRGMPLPVVWPVEIRARKIWGDVQDEKTAVA